MSKLSLSKIWKAYFSLYLLLFIFPTDWPWGLRISYVFIFILSQHQFQTFWTLCAPSLWVSSVLPRASEWPFRRATGNMLPSVTAGPFPPGNSSLYPLFSPPDILKRTPEALQRLTGFLTHSQLQQQYCSSHLTEHQSKCQMHWRDEYNEWSKKETTESKAGLKRARL